MKKSLVSLFLLMVFVIAWLKPSVPYIQFKLNKYYIQKYLCEQKDKPDNSCKGMCHLRKQIKKASEQKDEQNLPLPPKVNIDDYPVFDIVVFKGGLLSAWYLRSCFIEFNFYDFQFSKFVFHPPQKLQII
jgi:hypothetical protein